VRTKGGKKKRRIEDEPQCRMCVRRFCPPRKRHAQMSLSMMYTRNVRVNIKYWPLPVLSSPMSECCGPAHLCDDDKTYSSNFHAIYRKRELRGKFRRVGGPLYSHLPSLNSKEMVYKII